MNLHSINSAREEARYISRTWSNAPSAPDVSYPVHYKKPIESPDDIIGVCKPNQKTLSGWSIVYMTRREYNAERGTK